MRRLRLLLAAAVAVAAVITAPSAGAQSVASPRHAASLAGQLLVAAPSIPDPRFAEAVIYMVEHNRDGAMGIIVNRAVAKGPLADFLRGIDIDPGNASGDIRLHFGGPVQPGQGFVLHTPDYSAVDTLAIGAVVSVSTEIDVLEAIAAGGGPRRLFLAFGYAGWGPGQLESELDRLDWLVAPADEELVFGDDMDGKWRRAIAGAGAPL